MRQRGSIANVHSYISDIHGFVIRNCRFLDGKEYLQTEIDRQRGVLEL